MNIWKTRKAVAIMAIVGIVSLPIIFIFSSWAIHTISVTLARDGFRSDIDDARVALANVTEPFEEAEADLDDAREAISLAADDKADAQDFGDIYEYLSDALATCSRERETQIDVVKNRYRYIGVEEYEASLNDYCKEISSLLSDNIEEESKELPADGTTQETPASTEED